MKIVSVGQDRLVLEAKPWLIGGILIAVILVMAALAMTLGRETPWAGLGLGFGVVMFSAAFVAFVRRVIVIFDRAAGAVVIRAAGVLGQSERTVSLADIKMAAVETMTSSSSSRGRHARTRSETHRATLHLTGGEVVPLSAVFSGGGGAQQVVDAANRWLSGQIT